MNLLIRLCGILVVSGILGAAAFLCSARVLALLIADPGLGPTLFAPAFAGFIAGIVAAVLVPSKGK